jgi:coenzyme F420-0:L-glutamate ligase/coenzyme F420-1:gamma-L-glutamate ligase
VSGTDVAIIGIPGIPLVTAGDDLPRLIASALEAGAITLAPGDVLVVASTIVSKAEGRFFDLTGVVPSGRAHELAEITGKDPRLVEMVLRESTAVSRAVPGVLIVRHRLGFISANGGIDFSNVGAEGTTGILLPLDPDGSAHAIRTALEERTTCAPLAVVVADTHGRAFRRGNVGVAIGLSGLPAILDERGREDLFGRRLEATIVPFADQVAAAAGLVAGEAAEGLPVVIVRGLRYPVSASSAREIPWAPEEDLFA